jgi:sarcosine oxidase subunit alpha
VGGLARDRARVLDRLSRFLPVGFYYKAFHSKRLFPRWERMIRSMSGLGSVPLNAPRLTTAKRYAFCDVLVIGGGASGLAAALAAAQAGARVLIVDENPQLGGSGQWTRQIRGALDPPVREVESHTCIEVLRSTFAAGYYTDHFVALIEPERMTKVRSRAVVFATGVVEQPAVFRNNDLPGVMLGSGAQRLLHRYALAPGSRIIVLGANREAYDLCIDLWEHEIAVTELVDLRPEGESDAVADEVQRRGARILKGYEPVEAVADDAGCLCALRVAPITTDGAPAATQELVCDALLMSVGFAPACQLLTQAGAQIEFNESLQQHVPAALPPGIFAAGRVNGVYDDARSQDGRRAGLAAARHAGFRAPDETSTVSGTTRTPSHPFPIFDHARGKNFVDLDEDVQVKDLRDAAQEGFDSLELLKRFTTIGMGPSQGKHSNVNGARILARLRGQSLGDAGLTTMRPMFHPVPMKHLAGRGFQVERATPIHERHEALGAQWMVAGNWQRPEYYGRKGRSRAQCIAAEVSAVRTGLGLIDVGTLGKIEVFGPDAGALLDRVYAGRYSDLRVGMTRYGLMLDEAATIIDDGVIARLGEQRYYFTTTTSGSATVYRELLRWNALWGLDCALVNLTGQLGAFNLAGPKSRDALQPLTDIDLAENAFPYLGAREGLVCGARARVLRVGFVGELGYEIHVPAGSAAGVWDALLAAGQHFDIRPFGVEAQRLLRLEKGHIIVGQDTDGVTNPFEAHAAWAVKMQKPFFVGQRSLRILQVRGPRQQLVGFEVPGANPLKEAHLIIEGTEIAGRITSVAYSATLGRTVGLAMVRPDLARDGSSLSIRTDNGALVGATIVATPFYDPTGTRQT